MMVKITKKGRGIETTDAVCAWVRIPIKEKLRRIADAEGKSISQLLKELIEEFLERRGEL